MSVDSETVLLKTFTVRSTTNELSIHINGRSFVMATKMFRDVTTTIVFEALTLYLQSLSTINDDEVVQTLVKTPEGYQLKIGKAQ